MLIVVEGLDGSGKSTQVRKLKEYLVSTGRGFEYLHFPRFDTPVYGDLLARFLRGDLGSIDHVHPRLVALLFAEDRRAAAPMLSKALDNGKIVLLDRYVYSNIAFQCAKLDDKDAREELRQWIIELEYGIFGIPRPDLNIFLDVPVSVVSERLGRTRKGSDREYLDGKDDIHESDMDFQSRVRNVYMEQCELDKDFLRVDCSSDNGEMASPVSVFRKISALLSERGL